MTCPRASSLTTLVLRVGKEEICGLVYLGVSWCFRADILASDTETVPSEAYRGTLI